MELIINGEKETIQADTLLDVVTHYQLEKHLVVTEVNGEIIDRDSWAETKVEEGMKIELVHFVGGG
ncbi:thiamine biosynthesis protein ThiS [Alkalihalophilus pseudofirmus]|uniref:Sulfur carrier protein ThiS n=1 Tax=Alkalihalophilus pseudofirmus TaxID=79885 RepID=A0AAJ2KYD3_ALKPS|nr:MULTISPECIES: sulfur carrier protein ThiS [Alkalihalophilus]MDV2884053.1 sulfur carrier protein ThiS [Alkalihalophilus pseudofirmus]MED1601231.1 sulfur carrier protein ThiS [Alkalihalophilus marmarensis]OLS34106.1 thiamine biosynthesis protein ThiS [Alkalihalophilus pseudofirmus]WEG18077.1 sulfur carrier protein ThiS [Alkalihalophilus pseudofirmus]